IRGLANAEGNGYALMIARHSSEARGKGVLPWATDSAPAPSPDDAEPPVRLLRIALQASDLPLRRPSIAPVLHRLLRRPGRWRGFLGCLLNGPSTTAARGRRDDRRGR